MSFEDHKIALELLGCNVTHGLTYTDATRTNTIIKVEFYDKHGYRVCWVRPMYTYTEQSMAAQIVRVREEMYG